MPLLDHGIFSPVHIGSFAGWRDHHELLSSSLSASSIFTQEDSDDTGPAIDADGDEGVWDAG